jgi:hypothetical protein
MISRTDSRPTPDKCPRQREPLTIRGAWLDHSKMPDRSASRPVSDAAVLRQSALPLVLNPADAGPQLHLSLLLAPSPVVVAEVAAACV